MTDVNTDDIIRDEIIEHMGKAFFACAWADYEEEVEGDGHGGQDIMDVMPEAGDEAARKAAQELASALEKRHGMSLPEIFRVAKIISRRSRRAASRRYRTLYGGDRPRTAEMFGHYAAMGAMGHGVNLHDALGSQAARWVDVPYREFTYFDLDPVAYPIPEEAAE